MGVIDDIKSRVDIAAHIGAEVDLKPEAGGKRLKGCCPFHDDSTPSFYVFPDDGRFKCFGCDASGDILDYVGRRIGSADIDDAIDFLCDKYGISRPGYATPSGPTTDKPQARRIVQKYLHNAIMNDPRCAEAKAHLNGRGVTDAMIKQWGLGASTGATAAELKAQITEDTLVAIGVLGSRENKDKSRSTWEFIKQNIITAPVRNLDNQISHWNLKDPEKKAKFQLYKAARNDAVGPIESLNIFNATVAQKEDEFYLVEGFIDVIQIHAAGGKAIAANGMVTDDQINWLKSLRVGNAIFPEGVRKKKIFIWLDRDANAAGQTAAQKAAQDLYGVADVLVVRSKNLGDDPDDHLRKRGLSLADAAAIPYTTSTYNIEPTDDGYITNVKKDDLVVPVRITNFTIETKYHYIGDDHDRTRMVVVKSKRETVHGLHIKGEDTCARSAFNRWLHRKTRSCNLIDVGDAEYDTLMSYMRETDHSKTIKFSQFRGNVAPGVWLFDNGVIANGEIVRADGDGIIWYPMEGCEGVRTPINTDHYSGIDDTKLTTAQRIPETWMEFPEIIAELAKYYPPDILAQMLGFAVATICRDSIVHAYASFPLMLYVGETQSGKTSATELVRSLAGASHAPTDTLSSTKVGFLRHMAAFKNMPLHLTEYNSKYDEILKNIYDLHLYSRGQTTQGLETYDVPVNTSVIITSEKTPCGQSLLNRCLLQDFNRFHHSPETRADYKPFFTRCVTDCGGIGFLIHCLKQKIHENVIGEVKGLMHQLIKDLAKQAGDTRLVTTYSVVYGAFTALYNQNIPVMEPIFGKVGYPEVSRIVKEAVERTSTIVQSQDVLRSFFGYMNTMYNAGRIDKMVQLMPEVSPDKIRFHLPDIYNLVMREDRASRNVLEGQTETDISARIREEFDARAKSEKIFGVNKSTYTLPYKQLQEKYDVTFQPVEDTPEEAEPTFDPDELGRAAE